MDEIRELHSKISRIQRINSELFLISEVFQSFANAKTVEQIVDRLLEFCSEITGAQEVWFLSDAEKSRKHKTVKKENEEISNLFEFNEFIDASGTETNFSMPMGKCSSVQLSEKPKRSIILYNLPLPEKIAEYSDILSKVAGSFILALKEKAYCEQRDVIVAFLDIANKSKDSHELVKETLNFFQLQSGCDAVGIRLRDGEDFPYYEARGFSSEHLYFENRLCATDSANCVIHDYKGDPVIECMCGNIICGRFDPSKNFFTQNGSFWTNSTTQLLANTTEADRQAHTRNRCNGEGYESVALIPLRIGTSRLGLLQLNDRRKGMFNIETIKLWESLAVHLSLALSRTIAEEKLQDYTHNLENLIKERTQQLRNSERLAAIGTTAGMVGHDIRNPLQAIISDVYLAKGELASLPDSQEKNNTLVSMEEIEKNIDYINKIVQDLQDYARPLNPKPEESDLKQIVDKLVQKSEEGVKVNLEIPDSARKMRVDSYYLNRILYNLVTNALQAMPKGGILSVKSYKEVSDIIIEVEDTGVGIPEDIQYKMFTPMFTTKSKGQGFGLPVVKRMTEALGGTVTFVSQKGKGTTFKIRLPLSVKIEDLKSQLQ